MSKQLTDFFNARTILITGGTGSWGTELVKQLLKSTAPREIRIFSRGEHKQVEMKRRFQDPRLKFFVGDVRDQDRLQIATNNVDILFHLAALKHVPVCEENPYEAVLTNIVGTQNAINAAIKAGVERFVDVSTDKAVDPFNLYGVTKACGEKLVIAANLLTDTTRFVCIRGGNVLGTNGSVVPLFHEQILNHNAITITDNRMTRFIMRVEQAIELVLHAAANASGGEIFVMKMPAFRINDLADVMIRALGNRSTETRIIGIRPGEKIHETLVSRYEASSTHDAGQFYVILPQLRIAGLHKQYDSRTPLSHEFEEFNSSNTRMLNPAELESLLRQEQWLDAAKTHDSLAYLRSLDKGLLLDFFKSEGWVDQQR